MKSMIGRCAALVGLALSACTPAAPESAGRPPASLPLSVGNGLGSQHGNYAGRASGEIRDLAGDRCLVFVWDRPLSDTHAVRYTSASCPSSERPGRMVARQISREVVPLSESELAR